MNASEIEKTNVIEVLVRIAEVATALNNHEVAKMTFDVIKKHLKVLGT